MKKNDIIEMYIEGIDYPSKPYGYYEDKKAYTNINCIPGEKISGRIGKIKNNKIEIRDINILEKSPIGIKELCKVYNKCGGCSFQKLTYNKQLEIKVNNIYKMVKNISPDTIFEEPIISPNDIKYRNKMEFSFGNEYIDGPTILGLHKKNSFHDIVEVSDCKLMDDNFVKIYKYTNEYFKSTNTSFYHRLSHKGYLRNLMIRKGDKTKEILVNLLTTSQIYKEIENKIINEWLSGLLKLTLDSNIVGVLHTINDNLSDTMNSDEENIIYGVRDINERIFDLNFKISPYSFFQTNSLGIEKLYSKVIQYIDDIDAKIVFDLFSGTGTIGQIVSKKVEKVYGIEIIEEAVIKANENARINGITNAEFIAGDVFEKLDEFNEKNIIPDLIILDPPRMGVAEKTINKLLDYSVDNIVYVSCNPKTFVEDLIIFKNNGYELIKFVAVDMFSYTNHVECVCLLSRTEGK